VREFFRPHFFVNTPDINPYFLQTSGGRDFSSAPRSRDLVGAVGALLRLRVLRGGRLAGREEYLDSEKYELRVRDRPRPTSSPRSPRSTASVKPIRACTAIAGSRSTTPSTTRSCFTARRRSPIEDMILVAVSLDPHHAQEAAFEVPLWEWGLADDASIAVEDLMRQQQFVWTGKVQHLRLDPAELPFAIWRLTPLARGVP
jgi:starch synthase (maltosyl-transferring)